MGVWRGSTLLVLYYIAAAAGVYTAKGFYCRDPDTGSLYPVNSTWPSSTFCGSYTCKLRRKNQTEKLQSNQNVDNNRTNVQKDNSSQPKTEDIKKNCSEPVGFVMGEAPKVIESILHKNSGYDNSYINLENFKNIEFGAATKDGDRYLTEEEIKALTLLLQTMKKSDLEAILEIYNLAQDIYKEIDQVTANKSFHDYLKHDNSKQEYNPTISEIVDSNKNHVSYWYEPLTSSNHKHKVADVGIPITHQRASEPKDSEINDVFLEGSNMLEAPPRPISNSQAYFGGSLTSNDFGKLPYYYPISNFQRQSSYTHQNGVQSPSGPYPHNLAQPPNTQMVREEEIKRLSPQCCNNPETSVKNISPWYKIIHKPFTESKVKAPTLQYPMAYLQYNVSSSVPSTNVVVNSVVDNPWAFFNLHQRHHDHPPYLGPGYVAQLPKVFIMNPDPVEDSREELKSSKSKEETEFLPEWQTEPLSVDVINDVRANVAESKLLPFPFRRKVKLERVGKLMKMDGLTRRRRHVKNEEQRTGTDDFEVYIEKSTCLADTSPGFFRMGNSTQPYPACCPQRIGS